MPHPGRNVRRPMLVRRVQGFVDRQGRPGMPNARIHVCQHQALATVVDAQLAENTTTSRLSPITSTRECVLPGHQRRVLRLGLVAL